MVLILIAPPHCTYLPFKSSLSGAGRSLSCSIWSLLLLMKDKGRGGRSPWSSLLCEDPMGRGENMKFSRTKSGLTVVGEALSELVSLPGPKIDGWMSLQDCSNHEKYTEIIVWLPFSCLGTFLGLWPLWSRVMSSARWPRAACWPWVWDLEFEILSECSPLPPAPHLLSPTPGRRVKIRCLNKLFLSDGTTWTELGLYKKIRLAN